MVRKEFIMEDIKIITDTSSDIPQELVDKYDIGIVRFLTLFGEKEYVNGTEITNEQFYDMLETFDGVPTSSQPPFQYLYDFLLEESKKHKTIIFFTISSKASGEYQTANLVVNEIKENDNPDADIRIVDTQKFSVYIADATVHAAQMVQEGKNADEIVEECTKRLEKWRAYLLVDTLKYLEKGGRLSKTSAIVGTLLDIKPILTIEDGLVTSMDKLRGKKKLIDKLIEKIEEDPDFEAMEEKEFMVIHSDEDKLNETCEKLRDLYGDDCIKMTSEFGPLIGIHVGRGAIAIVPRISK